jgi:hypothetical protein
MSTVLLLSTLFNDSLYAQGKQLQQSKKRNAVVQLSFYKDVNRNKIAIAKVSSRNDSGKLVFVERVKIEFYFLQKSAETFLGTSVTDESGNAKISFSKLVPSDTSGITIIARLRDNKLYVDAETQETVKDANIVLTTSQKDSAKILTVHATEVFPNGEQRPIPNLEINFGIHRLFGIMPLGDEATATTDEHGIATFNFPEGINGDEKGKVVVAARIIDNDVYGNVETDATTSWGRRLVVDKNPFPRALWEPRAPISLIATFCVIFGGIWFTYGFVIYILVKIKNNSKSFIANTIS